MITYQLFESGFCRHCERMTLKTGKMKQREYPATCALIKHPTKGYILFDTGYSDLFFKFTQQFPYSLYRHLTPVQIEKTLKNQLIALHIDPLEIKYIVISHFHSDHIAGLCDYPNAEFICHKEALEDIQGKSRFRALLQGFLPDLLPQDFHQRLRVLENLDTSFEKSMAPFTDGFDLFGDKQVIAIPLPGHAKGQIGLYIKAEKDVFFVADSCWHKETFQELIFPSQLTYLIHDDKVAYRQTIYNLHALYKNNPHIDILPTHCEHTRDKIRGKEIC